MPTKSSNKKRYIPKRKVDKKQSKAIRQIKRALYTKCYTKVAPASFNIGNNSTTQFGVPVAYVQPLNPAMEQSTALGKICHDNQNTALKHERIFLWGTTNASNSVNSALPIEAGSGIRTTYCRLNYRLQSTERQMTEVCVAVIKPKRAFADQITKSRQFKLSALNIPPQPPATLTFISPGSASTLVPDVDYTLTGNQTATATSTVFGCKFNPQFWDVKYKRIHRLQAPATTNPTNQVGITNTNRAPNDQFGKISLSYNTYMRASVPALENDTITGFASQAQYIEVPNEHLHYLVVITNDSTAEEPITMTTQQNWSHNVYQNQITGAPR